MYESIILSGAAGTKYGRLPWLALSVLGGYTSNAASEGCHSIAQLIIMSDLQPETSMGTSNDILRIIVCLCDGNLKEAVEQLKATYADEAKNAELDITAKFKVTSRCHSELALQCSESSRHWHCQWQ